LQATPHEVPLHVAAPLAGTEQTVPHVPQVEIDDRLVSQPLMSGAVVLQSAKPAAQPVYAHDVPLQEAPMLWVVSQALPQPPQFVMDDRLVEQPPTFGGVVLQSA
jgi:hypothetical protein